MDLHNWQLALHQDLRVEGVRVKGAGLDFLHFLVFVQGDFVQCCNPRSDDSGEGHPGPISPK